MQHLPRAYPRSRGGTCCSLRPCARTRGLSPLARGNHFLHLAAFGKPGPIPARAGEPAKMIATRRTSPGLSPLARGNPQQAALRLIRLGPIPARAGEPPWLFAASNILGAYPRSRGGTPSKRLEGGAAVGLSPLARGNLFGRGLVIGQHGPIPARAGEPRRPRHLGRAVRAYPRSRWGTCFPPRCGRHIEGLSPLARGNRDDG